MACVWSVSPMSTKGQKRPNYGQRIPRVGKNGYRSIYKPEHPLAMKDGYVLEHRMVVHDAGIALPPGSQVHHINHDRLDNRLENLEVVQGGEHQRRHLVESGVVTNQFGVWPVGRDPKVRNHECYLRQKAKGNR